MNHAIIGLIYQNVVDSWGTTVSLFFTTMSMSYKTILSVHDHCMTSWGVQGCLYSYWQQQIGQSNCDITANCGKMYNTAFNFKP